MPPDDATRFPTDTERAGRRRGSAGRSTEYEATHAGEPGRVTVRRLTSAEYAYALGDLTGIDVKVGIDASSDSVGGEGFANFGDVQFVQDASRRAVSGIGQAGRRSRRHRRGPAVLLRGSRQDRAGAVGAATGSSSSTPPTGFRVVSGEGGRPFGFERYGKAFYVAWHYKHRVALGDPAATIRGLAAREGITGRFAEHIWTAVNKADTGYPIG